MIGQTYKCWIDPDHDETVAMNNRDVFHRNRFGRKATWRSEYEFALWSTIIGAVMISLYVIAFLCANWKQLKSEPCSPLCVVAVLCAMFCPNDEE